MGSKKSPISFFWWLTDHEKGDSKVVFERMCLIRSRTVIMLPWAEATIPTPATSVHQPGDKMGQAILRTELKTGSNQFLYTVKSHEKSFF